MGRRYIGHAYSTPVAEKEDIQEKRTQLEKNMQRQYNTDTSAPSPLTIYSHTPKRASPSVDKHPPISKTDSTIRAQQTALPS